jgi:hypothetical protein
VKNLALAKYLESGQIASDSSPLEIDHVFEAQISAINVLVINVLAINFALARNYALQMTNHFHATHSDQF